jgi:5'-nucleotidase
MRILLTNDDGIDAAGIKALWQALKGKAKIFVAAPATEQSARSQAITVHDPIRIDDFYIDGRIKAWRIGGTPVDCVKLALEMLLKEKPDVIISGINRGPNLGCDVLYSGTVGAAMEGGMKNILSLALSVDTREDDGFGEAAKFAAAFVDNIDDFSLHGASVLNINFPRQWKFGEPIVPTRLGKRDYINLGQMRQDPTGRNYCWMGGKIVDLDKGDGTDLGAAAEGKATVTPLQLDITAYSALKMLKGW